MGWIAPLLVFVLLAAPALRLARKTGVAERSVAAFFLATAAGLALRLVAVTDGAADSPLELVLNAFGHACLSAACVALFVFTRSVFRPTERWAIALQRAGTAGAALTLAGVFLGGGIASEEARSVLLANFVRTASYAWCFIESLRYWRMMRRRVAMSLAEPVVANRFGLWCVWTGGLTACLGFVLLGRVLGLLLGVEAGATPRVLGVIQLIILVDIVVSMVAIWLAFFPPARYLDWVERRSVASSG